MIAGRAIVTGASSGIGRAVAIELARSGVHVVASARRAERLAETVAGEGQAQIVPFPADLTDPAQVHDLFRAAAAAVGPIDTVVHSVGHEYPIALLADAAANEIPRAVAALITSPALVLREALATFDDDRPGRIILVSSGAGSRALPGRVLYSAAKAAVNQLVRSAAVEAALRPSIAVAAILPGRVDTPMQRRLVETAQSADPSLGLGEFRTMTGVSDPADIGRAVAELVARDPAELNGHIFRYSPEGWKSVE